MKPIPIDCIKYSIQILNYSDFFKNVKIQGVEDENLDVIFQLALKIQNYVEGTDTNEKEVNNVDE